MLTTPLFISCKQPVSLNKAVLSLNIDATITNKIFYQNVPSASGLEAAGNKFYVIGDDSPYLYELNQEFKLINQLALSDVSGFESGRVAKHSKMDLESLASFTINGKSYLLIIGSGATEARMTTFIVEIDAVSGTMGRITSYSLKKIYEKLKANKQVIGEGVLNIEGSAVFDGKLYLLQRAVANEPNVLLVYDFPAFLEALKENKEVPEAQVLHFNLAKIGDVQAGFSGAYIFDAKLFYTASVEQTENAIADGEVLGSYIGYIELENLGNASKQSVTQTSALLMYPDGSAYKGKAESLVVTQKISNRKYDIVVVSDDDKGHSELLEVTFSIR
jgi:hypothetical protein